MMVPTEGRAVIAGYDVARDPAAVRRTVGVVFQTQSLDKALTVEENLRSQGHLHGLSGATLRDRMERRYGAPRPAGPPQGPGRDASPAACAGASRSPRRSCTDRKVLIMDEASTGLDPAARRDVSRHVETCATRKA